MVLWNGGLRPGEPAYGFELLPDGHLREASGDGYGHVHVDHVLALSPDDLAGVRGAVRDLLDHGPSVARDTAPDGSYTSIAIDAGAAQRVVLDTGQASAYVQSLFARLGHAVKPNDRAHVDPPRPDYPDTTACPPGHQATEVQKDVPLKDAAEAGILHIGPKGVIGGDSTRVKATWKDVAAPTTITVHIEIVNQPGDTTSYAQR